MDISYCDVGTCDVLVLNWHHKLAVSCEDYACHYH